MANIVAVILASFALAFLLAAGVKAGRIITENGGAVTPEAWAWAMSFIGCALVLAFAAALLREVAAIRKALT